MDFENEDIGNCRVEWLPYIAKMDLESFECTFQAFVKCLVRKCDWHVHNDTCFKHLHSGVPHTGRNCHMHINGKTQLQTELDAETQSIQLHPWINNFNDTVLFLIESNMDIKYVGSGPAAKALIYYIMDYIIVTAQNT